MEASGNTTFWVIFFSTFAGAFAGAVLGLISIWYKYHLDSKQELNDWFFDHFIFNGTSAVLIETKKIIESYLIPKEIKNKLDFTFPLVPLYYICQILRTNTPSICMTRALTFFFDDDNVKANEAQKEVFLDLYAHYTRLLTQLELSLISLKIKSKRNIYSIYKRKDILHLAKEFDIMDIKMGEMIKKMSEIPRPQGGTS